MKLAKTIREEFDEIWDRVDHKEGLATAGEFSVYVLERLAGVFAMKGDDASARKVLKAAMELEATVHPGRTPQNFPKYVTDRKKLH